jgi:hypothetical protein
MYGEKSNGQLSIYDLLQALNHLWDLLAKKNQRLELVCCGGVVSVLYHHSRQTIHAVDVLSPNNPSVVKTLRTLIDQVGQKLHLDHDEHNTYDHPNLYRHRSQRLAF